MVCTTSEGRPRRTLFLGVRWGANSISGIGAQDPTQSHLKKINHSPVLEPKPLRVPPFSPLGPWLNSNSMYRPGWPQIHQIPPSFATLVLGLKASLCLHTR